MNAPEVAAKRQRVKRHESQKIGIILLITFLIFSSLAFTIGLSFNGGKVYPGVRVAGINLSGMTAVEAEAAVAQRVNQQVTLVLGDAKYNYSLQSIGLSPDIKGAVQKALEVGHGMNPIKVLAERARIKRDGYNIPLTIKINKTAYRQAIEKLKEEIEIPSKDAKLRIDGSGRVIITPEVVGKKVNDKALLSSLARLATRDNAQITIPMVPDYPEITADKIAGWGITEKISSFTTNFSTSIPERKNNIRVAAGKIDGTLLMPGEEFSFNGKVGKRTVESGFGQAFAYVNGKLKKDIGGGVCQVSSTLYNAILLAGLQPEKRSNHSSLVTYVKPGLDATVDYGNIDFVFRNTLQKPVYIQAEVWNDNLTVNVYGQKTGITYSLVSQVLKTVPYKKEIVYVNDPAEVKVQQGHNGVIAVAYRIAYKNGKEISKERLGTSVYKPMNEIVYTLKPTAANAAAHQSQGVMVPAVPAQANQGSSAGTEGDPPPANPE